jgi:hypothetical protein
MFAPLMVWNPEMFAPGAPAILPVAVKAPILVAETLATLSVAVVPLSIKESILFELPSLMVKLPLTPACPKLSVGFEAEKTKGLLLDKVRVALAVAPLCVTE